MPKTYLKTPLLNEYMYDLCYNLPTDVIKTLPIRYRRILHSEKATKNLCIKSTIDEKLQFFYYIGLTNALTIFPETIKGKNQVKEFFKKYDEEKLASVKKDHAVLNIYVSTDRETSHLMGLMGMTISDKGFALNYDYNKTSYHLKGWGKKLESTEINELNDTVESADLVAKTMLNTANSLDLSDILHGVKSNDLKVLLFLFLRRGKYTIVEKIWEYFLTYTNKRVITSCIKRLLLNEYLQKHIDWRTPSYVLSAKGINLVYDFMKRILKQNNFD